jgi:multisubunit Na+/H+ antiporter MnhB subunit
MNLMDIAGGGFDMGITLLLAAIVVLIIFGVVTTFLRTRSWVPAVGALFVGVIVLWMANNITTLAEVFDRTVTEAGNRGSRADEDLGRLDPSDIGDGQDGD